MSQTVSGRATKFLLREFFGEVLYFPVWWYTDGLRWWSQMLLRQLIATEYRLAVRILVRTLFQPMYGDRTRSGRIISFFMRLVLIVGKGLTLVVWASVFVCAWVLWIGGPVLTLGLLIRQIIPTS